MRITKVIGPPGTGKTHYLQGQIARAADKYDQSEIGGMSYTTAGAGELARRVGWEGGRFKTMHSHLYGLIGVRSDQIADRPKIYRAFGERYPEFLISYTGMKDDGVGVGGADHDNDRLFREIGLNRNRLIPEEAWDPTLKPMWTAWQQFLLDNDLVDYTGILEQGLLHGQYIPDFRVMFVDECQDMTPLQMAVAIKWAESMEHTVMAGDADQALFTWNGADPGVFRDLAAERTIVLKQSWRVPPRVHEYAMETIRQVSNREDVEYLPYEVDGPGEMEDVLDPDLEMDGEHMILHRCNYQVDRTIERLIDADMLWRNEYRRENKAWNPCLQHGFRAVRAYLRLQQFDNVAESEFKVLIKCVIANGNLQRGAKKAFSAMPHEKETVNCFDLYAWADTEESKGGFCSGFLEEKKPFRELFRLTGKTAEMLYHAADSGQTEVFERTPEITVGTVHSVKGGAADNVWLHWNLPRNIRKEMSESEEAYNNEMRVKYVGITRARKYLGVWR